ncbi:MAG: hypothetical protein ACT4QD_17880, partial [Acidobacteriota bacterium]
LHSPQPGAAQTTSEVSLGNVTKETKLSFTGSFTILNPAPQITVTARVEIPNLADGLVVIAHKSVSKTRVAFSGQINFADFIKQPTPPVAAKLILSSTVTGTFGPTKVTR